MTRPLALPTALALLALLAGCTAGPGTGTTNASTTAPTTTTEPTTAPVTDTTTEPRTGTGGCPYYLTVEPATDRQIAEAETVLAYENLSAARQSEFDRARTNRNGTIALDTLPEVWSRPRVVEHEDDLYATVASTC